MYQVLKRDLELMTPTERQTERNRHVVHQSLAGHVDPLSAPRRDAPRRRADTELDEWADVRNGCHQAELGAGKEDPGRDIARHDRRAAIALGRGEQYAPVQTRREPMGQP